jgi:serine O-acetyltransferase
MQLILRLHRLSSRLQQARMGALSRSVDGILRVFFAACLPGRARIGERVFFHHNGLGVVINALCLIEDDCEIGVHVVLGGRSPEIGAPHLGRGVIVHAGARIIGPVRIGAGAVVGANAVVLDDVPSGCLAVGVPAVVKRTDVDRREYAHRGSPR